MKIVKAISVVTCLTSLMLTGQAQADEICRVVGSDPDGDGFGFEAGATCVVTNETGQTPQMTHPRTGRRLDIERILWARDDFNNKTISECQGYIVDPDLPRDICITCQTPAASIFHGSDSRGIFTSGAGGVNSRFSADARKVSAVQSSLLTRNDDDSEVGNQQLNGDGDADTTDGEISAAETDASVECDVTDASDDTGSLSTGNSGTGNDAVDGTEQDTDECTVEDDSDADNNTSDGSTESSSDNSSDMNTTSGESNPFDTTTAANTTESAAGNTSGNAADGNSADANTNASGTSSDNTAANTDGNISEQTASNDTTATQGTDGNGSEQGTSSDITATQGTDGNANEQGTSGNTAATQGTGSSNVGQASFTASFDWDVDSNSIYAGALAIDVHGERIATGVRFWEESAAGQTGFYTLCEVIPSIMGPGIATQFDSVTNNENAEACLDVDGDGFGWDGSATCIP